MSINLPKVCDPRSQAWSRFCLILKEIMRSINLPKVCGSRSQTWPMFYLISTQVIWNINLPKVCGPRNQAWPSFYLIFIPVINATHNVINENMAKLSFINNSIFVGYLYSKVAGQFFHLNLLGSMHLCLLPRWYSMAFPNWVLTSPKLGFLQYPQPFSVPSP